MVVVPWHYIPELPEFTICEDCYDDVVWPLADSPIANMVSRTLKAIPGKRPVRDRLASCQLSSPRMRAKFRKAVQNEDFAYLKATALARYQAEIKFRDRKERLLDDSKRGRDCDVELRKNIEEWKKYE
jgi:hypothetical protein